MRFNNRDCPFKTGELPKPVPKQGELLIKVSTCGVCHTEIDEIEGRTPPPVFLVVQGRQAVGTVEQSLRQEIKSVANVTGNDVRAFIQTAAKMKFKPKIQIYPFAKVHEALLDIKNRKIKGAKVLNISGL